MNDREIIEKYRGNLAWIESIYHQLRKYPESVSQGSHIASIITKNLPNFFVTSLIGGDGVAAVLHNRKGPTVTLRVIMDDLHTPTLLGTATLLLAARDHWTGTLVCIFQPGGFNTGHGARAMIADGLWDPEKHNIPVPTIILGQQIRAMETGIVALRPGTVVAAVDAYKIRIFGKGGHGARPDRCIDPILTAANIVTRLQTVVSREAKPGQLAVISCGSIHGGDTAHIIPDHVDLQVTARACSTEVQKRLLAGIDAIVRGECATSGARQEPTFTLVGHAAAIFNAEKPYHTLHKAFQAYFPGEVVRGHAIGVSEDFSLLADECKTPYAFWHVGLVKTEEQTQAEKGVQSPGPGDDSPEFAIQPTMKIAIDAFALAALAFLEKRV